MPAPKSFHQALKSKSLQPVYILVSEDKFLLTESISILRDRALTQAPDFNRHDFRIGFDPLPSVFEAANTLPMMAPTRWVHLADIDKLKAKDAAPLLDYLQAPSETTVLCISGTKVDKRTKVGQALAKSSGFYQLAPPKPRQAADWVYRRASESSWKIDRDACQLLVDLVGHELGTLDAELQKLAVYAGSGETITAESVLQSVSPTRVHSIFEFTDAIGNKDLGAASTLLRNALDGGENGLMILAMIARQVRLLLKTKHHLEHGVPERELARAVRVNPYTIQSLIQQSRQYDEATLCEGIGHIARCDHQLKSSKVNPGVILDKLLVDLMTNQGASV